MKRKASFQKTPSFGSKKPRLVRQGAVYGAARLRTKTGLSVERKYVDISATANSLNSTGAVQAINLSAQGDDNISRDGRETQNISVAIRGLIRPEDNSTPAPTLVRVMLVWDKQSNGALATIAQILQNSTALSFNNLDNKKRFVVLRDKQFAVGGVDNTATQALAMSPTVHSIYEFVKLPADCITTWSASTGVIGSVTSGSLLLVQIGTGAATAGASLEAFTRVRFVG